MKDKDVLTDKVYRDFKSSVNTDRGSVTSKAQERHDKGLGLDPLVDPSSNGVIRRSLNRMEPEGLLFRLVMGIAILIEERLDATGSFKRNVDIAFRVLPRTYELLKKVLGRYDLQMITAIFGDALDNYILCRSHAEMGIKIAEQMTLMVPEGGGKGNHGEDPQYGLFAAAYLTSADINRYGLKSYDFTVTDEPSHEPVLKHQLERVFGKEVFDRVRENGFEIDPDNLPSVKQVIDKLLERAHAFLFLVDMDSEANDYWTTVIDQNRIIYLEDTNYLPEVKAAIIGLTEGVLTLFDLEEFLVNEANVSKDVAKMIKRAVAGIPIGAQTLFENFDKIPVKGDLFKEKRDLWPTEDTSGGDGTEESSKTEWL